MLTNPPKWAKKKGKHMEDTQGIRELEKISKAIARGDTLENYFLNAGFSYFSDEDFAREIIEESVSQERYGWFIGGNMTQARLAYNFRELAWDHDVKNNFKIAKKILLIVAENCGFSRIQHIVGLELAENDYQKEFHRTELDELSINS